MRPTADQQRLQEIKFLLSHRIPYRKIGEYFGVSGARVGQIIKQHLQKYIPSPIKKPLKIRYQYLIDKWGVSLEDIKSEKGLWLRYIFRNAQRNPATIDLPFNLDFKHIYENLPEICPVFGIKLDYSPGKGIRQDNSPSLDRLYPDKGYVDENVSVISWRANRIKNNSSLEELEQLVNWFKNKIK